MSVVSIWYSPSADCTSIEFDGGRKAYARVFGSAMDRVEWGWVLQPDAECLWSRDLFDPEASAAAALAQEIRVAMSHGDEHGSRTRYAIAERLGIPFGEERRVLMDGGYDHCGRPIGRVSTERTV